MILSFFLLLWERIRDAFRSVSHFQHSSEVFGVTAAEVFQYHERPGTFERLQPPWEDIAVVERSPSFNLKDGVVKVRMRLLGPLATTITAKHVPQGYQPGTQFQDAMEPCLLFRKFEHTHTFSDLRTSAGCLMTDKVEYELPFGFLGRMFGGWVAKRQLTRMFHYRHEIVRQDCTRMKDLACQENGNANKPLKVAVTGSSGLIGSALVASLSACGHSVIKLVRNELNANGEDVLYWNPTTGVVSGHQLQQCDAVVHLAGENIVGCPPWWTATKKVKIRDSRVSATKSLCQFMCSLQNPPPLFISASGISVYGSDCQDRTLLETSALSDDKSDFLCDVARAWESATDVLHERCIRVINLRIGLVLSPSGGALKMMLPAFQCCVGGRIGSGQQYMSWIALDDVIGIIHYCLHHSSLSGPINSTAPSPCTNLAFTKALGAVLHRPTLFPVPAKILKAILGDMAENTLLSSLRVYPDKLLANGYTFLYSELDLALKHMLGA